MDKAKVICVARVKNEASTIKRFLETASIWADVIIIYDQNSEDDTVAIAKTFSKAQVLVNNNSEFNEVDFASLLAEARKIEGKKFIVVLDADECLSANIIDSPEWQTAIHSKEGSIFNISRIEMDNNFSEYRSSMRYWFAIMDDGITDFPKVHVPGMIHTGRIPFPGYETNLYFLYDIVMLHYSMVSPERTASKSRWYQCFERIYSKKTNLQLIKQYTQDSKERIQTAKKHKFKDDWFDGYKKLGIDMTSVIDQYDYWQDRKVLEYFETYGTGMFKRLNIWTDKDWYQAYKNYGYKKLTEKDFKRNLPNRIVMKYLRATSHKDTVSSRFINKMLNRFY